MNTHDGELVYNPTPQDYGFPEKPTHRDVKSWDHQEAFLKHYATTGQIQYSARSIGIHPCTVEYWQAKDHYGFNKRLEIAFHDYREYVERDDEDYIRNTGAYAGNKSPHDIMRIHRKKSIWPEKYGDNVTITADTPLRQMLEQMRQIGLAQQRALEGGAAEGEYREVPPEGGSPA